jgi:hypothetical protein
MEALVNGRLVITSARTNADVAKANAGQATGHPKLIRRFLALLMTSLSGMNV